MKLEFRQGLVSFQQDVNGRAQFLQPSTRFGYVSLNVSPSPVVASFAFKDANYLQVFDKSTVLSWGPLTAGNDNYLYWDIDLLTAEVTTGITLFEPVYSSIMPAVKNDLHWFDLNENIMKVWSTRAEKWIQKIRLFAGKVIGGSTNQIVQNFVGTQANLNSNGLAGFILLDTQLRPLRTSTGTFLTSQTDVRVKTTSGTSGVLATPLNAFVPVRAGQNIPAMTAVYFSGEDTVSIASSDPIYVNEKKPFGLIQETLAENEIGNLTQSGEIVYDQWDWSNDFGKTLYIDSFGKLTTIRPQGLLAYHVGVVKNKNTIVFGIDAETQPQVYQANASQMIISGQMPITTNTQTNVLGEVVTTISIQPATSTNAGSMSAQQASKIDTIESRFSTVENNIVNLFSSKAQLRHTHVMADITDLQIALDGKMSATKNFDDRYAPLNINFDTRYAQINHTHTIGQVSGLQSAIESKANRFGTLVALSAVWENVDRTAATDVGTGNSLSSILNGKSNVNHTHQIDDVASLRTNLDSKALINHTHSISNINNLQPQLDLISTKLNLSGGSMTGTLILSSDPINPQEAATKQYVDSKLSSTSPSASTVFELTDVQADVLSTADGSVLTFFNEPQPHWEAIPSGNSGKLMELLDVQAPNYGQVEADSILIFNTSIQKWEAQKKDIPEFLFDLLDVQPPAYGQFFHKDVLAWNGNTNQWEPMNWSAVSDGASGGNIDLNSASLFDLGDVIHNPNVSEIGGMNLMFDGVQFYPAFTRMETVQGFSIPNDYTTIPLNHVLTWNGSSFQPKALPTAPTPQPGASGATKLDELSDVELPDYNFIGDGQPLVFDAQNYVFKPGAIKLNKVEVLEMYDGQTRLGANYANSILKVYNNQEVKLSIERNDDFKAGDIFTIAHFGQNRIVIDTAYSRILSSPSNIILTELYETVTLQCVYKTSNTSSQWVVIGTYKPSANLPKGRKTVEDVYVDETGLTVNQSLVGKYVNLKNFSSAVDITANFASTADIGLGDTITLRNATGKPLSLTADADVTLESSKLLTNIPNFAIIEATCVFANPLTWAVDIRS